MAFPRRHLVVVGAITAAAVVIFFTTAARALYFVPEEELSVSEVAARIPSSASSTVHAVVGSSVPVKLEIPTIGVTASIVDVGIGKSGNMAVPASYSDVGWYRYGPQPGAQGSAVMDGHLDNGFGLDAVFRHIGELQVGDEIRITRADGKRLTFAVTGVASYKVEDVPLAVIFNKENGVYLNLITCDGAWSNKTVSYDKRLVVYTSLVE